MWNDVSGIDSKPPDAHVYTKGEVRDICRKAFFYGRIASKINPLSGSYIMDSGHKTQAEGEGRGICV